MNTFQGKLLSLPLGLEFNGGQVSQGWADALMIVHILQELTFLPRTGTLDRPTSS